MSDQLDDDRVPPNQVLSHLGVMALVSAVLGVIVAGLAIPFAGVLGFAARDVADSMRDLPQSIDARPLAERTRILDRNGKEIASLYDENRVSVPLTSVAKVMRQSIVSIEDYRFYQHGALDLKGTLRALVTNASAGGVTQGGSSITQQMVKLTLVSQAKTKAERLAATEQSFERKVKELRYAIAFEENYSKDWILERYLNIAYFGDGAYGVQAAAKHYFNTDASKLNLTQAATLAGLVKNPVGYDPTRNPSKALDRRNTVLERMAQLRVITPAKARAAAKQPLGLDVQKNRNGCMFSPAPFFCDYVVSYLMLDPSLGATRDDRKELLYNAGLTIKTTVDMRFQNAANDAVERYVYPTDNAVGGLAMVEPGTGEVRAIAQSRPMGTNKGRGQTFINYGIPKKYGGSGGFQPGSTFKAFVLASAIRQGIPLTTSFNSPGFLELPQSDFANCKGAGNFVGTYPVHNAGDQNAGTRNLYTGTAGSINTFYVQLERKTGVCDPWKLANKMGVQVPVRDRQPSFTLGAASATPLQIAEAYATFAARGIHCASRPVTVLEDANGNTVKAYKRSCGRVLKPAVADAVNDVLQGAFRPGGTANGIRISQPTAGKTGTTNNAFATWLTGYTPNLAMSAVIAGANSAGHTASLNGQSVGGRYISSGSGAGTTGPIWQAAMDAVAPLLPDAKFTKPSAESVKGVLVPVPRTWGMSISQATQLLEGAGFTVTVADGNVDSEAPFGTVAYTTPGSGSNAGSGSVVTIHVSDGTPYVRPKPTPKKSPTKSTSPTTTKPPKKGDD